MCGNDEPVAPPGVLFSLLGIGMHTAPLANNRVSRDLAIPTYVDAIEVFILAPFVRLVANMAVLVVGEFEARPVGTSARAVAIFLSCLATAPFET